MQFFNKTEAILNIFFTTRGLETHIFGFLCLYRPDFDRITILETFIIKKLEVLLDIYVSHLGFMMCIILKHI